MATIKKFRFEHLSVFIIAILLVVSVIINISSAYFTDSASASNSTQLVFGTIAVRAKPEGENYSNNSIYAISADEVAMKNDLYKLIVLENEEGVITQPFYLRVSLVFYNNSEIANQGDLVVFDIALSSEVTLANYGENYYQAAQNFDSTHWLNGNNDGMLYYNTELSLPQASSKIYIPVRITFSDTFGYENFNNPYLVFNIDIIQSANSGYTSWSTRPVAGWPVVS